MAKTAVAKALGGRSGNRVPSTFDPETLKIRTRVEQSFLLEVEKRRELIFAWIDARLGPTVDADGEIIPAVATSMNDKPMVDLIKSLIDKAIPERRQVEASNPSPIGRVGALFIVGDPDVKRGTKAARDASRRRTLEMRKTIAGDYEPEGGAAAG